MVNQQIKALKKNDNTNITQQYNFLRLLPYISDTTCNNNNFIYYHSKATHLPWHIVNDNGNLIKNVGPYNNQKWFLYTFAKWIKWMKENGVYDNTKIIILSDHAHHLNPDKAKEFGDTLKWSIEGQKKLSSQYFWRLNALLMVKDFNSHGKLKQDWRFMSNADAISIALNNDNPTNNSVLHRTLPVTFVDWVSKIENKKKIKILYKFEVHDYIYDPKNWYPKKIE